MQLVQKNESEREQGNVFAEHDAAFMNGGQVHNPWNQDVDFTVWAFINLTKVEDPVRCCGVSRQCEEEVPGSAVEDEALDVLRKGIGLVRRKDEEINVLLFLVSGLRHGSQMEWTHFGTPCAPEHLTRQTSKDCAWQTVPMKDAYDCMSSC